MGLLLGDESSTLHLLCTLFLLLLQSHLRSSGMRSQSLGTPEIQDVYSHIGFFFFFFVTNRYFLCLSGDICYVM